MDEHVKNLAEIMIENLGRYNTDPERFDKEEFERSLQTKPFEEGKPKPGDTAGHPTVKPSPFAGRKSLVYRVKAEGTCEPGQTAAQTGCTPASGDGSKKPTAGQEGSSEPVTISGLEEQLPIDEYGHRRGTKPLGKISVRAYRIGKVTDKANRGAVFFSGDADSVKPYAMLHEGEEVKEYTINLENAILAGHQNDLCKLFFNKTYGDMMDGFQRRLGKKGAYVASAAFDKKLADEARKHGYDGIIYTSPAPPANAEVAVLGKIPSEHPKIRPASHEALPKPPSMS